MPQLHVVVEVLYWFAVAAYAAATVFYVYFVMSKKKSYSWYATFLTGAGFLCQTASIGIRSSLTGGTLMTGGNSLVLAAWALVLVYFVVEHLAKLKIYGAVLVPIACLLMLAARVIGVGSTGATPAEADALAVLLRDWRTGIHVVLVMLANAGFSIGAAASIVYLLQESQLKRHTTGGWLKRLPSLAQTDLVARRAISWSYPAYTAGLLIGIVNALGIDRAGWWADPRIMMAGVVWAVFGVYLYLHYGRGVQARTSARVAIVGLVFVVALSIIARTLPLGFHVFGVAGT